jgi:hypothetical protein
LLHTYRTDSINAIVRLYKLDEASGRCNATLGDIAYTLPLANASLANASRTVRPTFYPPFAPFFKRDSDGYAMVRFGRFAALAPDNGKENAMADTADGSKLTPARYLVSPMLLDKAIDASKMTNWTADMVEHAWAVQTANVAIGAGQLVLGDDKGDTFGAESKVWYGGHCISIQNE